MSTATFEPSVGLTPDDAITSDPEAPYGRFANGNPRKRPPKSSVSGQRRGRKPKGKDYTEGIQGIFQLVSIPLSFAAPADAWAVATHGPGIATELNKLAQDRPEVAAVLDRVLAVGPYGAIVSAVLPLAIQLLHNHGVVPQQVATSLGAAPKDAILEGLRQSAERQRSADSENPA